MSYRPRKILGVDTSHSGLLVHSDARAVVLLMREKVKPDSSNLEIVSNVIQHLTHVFDKETIILPAPNYDFTSTDFFTSQKIAPKLGQLRS